MSIWSSFHQVEPLREAVYGRDILPNSWIDLADTGCRGTRGDLLRLCIDAGPAEEACAVLDRQQAIELRDRLTAWLERCPGSAGVAAGGVEPQPDKQPVVMTDGPANGPSAAAVIGEWDFGSDEEPTW